MQVQDCAYLSYELLLHVLNYGSGKTAIFSQYSVQIKNKNGCKNLTRMHYVSDVEICDEAG